MYRGRKVKIYKSQNILIIGGGQAGLLTGYYLRSLRLPFLILDSNQRIGDSWRKRYDSLRLLTPRSEDSLPGMKLGGKSEGFPTKDELADYLERYAKKFKLSIKLNTTATKLQKHGNIFKVQTDNGIYFAKNIIIATGAFQKPFIPNNFKNLSKKIFQIHAAFYKCPKQIPKGKVLIIGAGNSGAQIAEELALTHRVTLSTKRNLVFHNKFDFLYILATKIFKTETIRKIVNLLKISKVHTPNLENFLKKGNVILKPALVKIEDNNFFLMDNTTQEFSSIIWATGYTLDFSWIKIMGAFNNREVPFHKGGESVVKGLYFIYPEDDYAFIRDLPTKIEKIIKIFSKEL